MYWIPPGSCVHGISKPRILEWVSICSSRGSSWPSDWLEIGVYHLLYWQVILYCWTTRECPVIWIHNIKSCCGIYLDLHILSAWSLLHIWKSLDPNSGDLISSPNCNNYWLHDFHKGPSSQSYLNTKVIC